MTPAPRFPNDRPLSRAGADGGTGSRGFRRSPELPDPPLQEGGLNKRTPDPHLRILETVWIPLADGTRLAARIWLPVGADAAPVPAILEYLPYRRRDRHRSDDSSTHPYFAARGYAAVRVDMRGSGDSDGLMRDEYTPQEWADACEVIAWLSAQPWCDGAVGMMGLSWSGFNALQLAALRPPALKAVISACASDDRYADDMHYKGGCLLHDNLQYGATLFTWLGTPPDPEIVGERWREMWLARLDAVSPPALTWMRHQERDAYWRSGSVACDYSAIRVPVLAVGGWSDGYRNAVMRLLTHLPGPRKGLIGPWSHAFPHVATPGPAIDFLAYATRWWDHWLKGRDTGIMDEPMLTCWMQESEPPRPAMASRAGRWIAERTWPSENVAPRRFQLAAGGLATCAPSSAPEPAAAPQPLATVASPPDTGTGSGEWCPYGWGPDLPLDQRHDDSASAVFDSQPLEAPVEILGGARVILRLEADAAEAMLAVRLNDVSPDGVSRRITYGLLNLAYRGGYERARPLESERAYDVAVALDDVGYAVPAGHRLRVALSSAYWPLAVGFPHPVTLRVLGGHVDVPVRQGEGAPPPGLGTADVPPYPSARPISPPARGRTAVTRDLAAETTRVDVVRDLGVVALDDVNLELQAKGSETYAMPWRDPARARAVTTRLAGFRRPGWSVEVRTSTSLSFESSSFRFEATLEAFEDGRRLFARSWSEAVRRSSAPAAGPVAGPSDQFSE